MESAGRCVQVRLLEATGVERRAVERCGRDGAASAISGQPGSQACSQAGAERCEQQVC